MKADTFKVKKPRVDKRKNVGKVAEALIKNPNKTVREIAKETNMSIGAVHSNKKELEQS
jgi:DNA-binding MarR family transcriptional regulator